MSSKRFPRAATGCAGPFKILINKIVEENEFVASQRRNASPKAIARARAAAWDEHTTSCWRPGRLGLPGGRGPGRAALRAYLVYGVKNA